MRIHNPLPCLLAVFLLQFLGSGGASAQSSLSFALKNGKTISFEDRAGSYWPSVHIDDKGFTYIGDKVLDSNTGLMIRDDSNPNLLIVGSRFAVLGGVSKKALTLLRKDGACKLELTSLQLGLADKEGKDVPRGRVRFAESANALGVLSAIFDEEGKIKYRVPIADPKTCRVISSVDLGNPDLLIKFSWLPEGDSGLRALKNRRYFDRMTEGHGRTQITPTIL